MVVKGVIEEDDARQRIADLKAQRLQVEAEIATLEEAPKIITLHPATLDRYIETVEALAASVAEHAEAEDDRGSLVKSFRALVHSVTVHPNGPREGFEVEVKGKLAALIGGDAFPRAVYSGGRVVAEDRFESPTHRLKIGWPNEYGCTERGIHYFTRLKRRSPCSERPGIRPFLSNRAPKVGTDPAVPRIGKVAGAPILRQLAVLPRRKSSDSCIRISH
jgi:hypothetical protein